MTTMSLRIAVWIPAGLALVAVAPGGCQRPAAQVEREVGPGVMVLRMPSALGRRPPVEFDHDRHTAKVKGKNSCKTCHLVDRAGSLSPKFLRVNDGQSASKLMDHYHDRCQGCHKRRGKGARGCGECHAKRPRTRTAWVALRMDYSLHARHVLAQQKRCADCHHVYDKVQKKLVYKKGTEERCKACHTDRTEGRRPSLRLAAHRACVSCHLQNAGQTTGPLDCAGCHGAQRQAKIKRLDRYERLLRGQKDRLWVKAKGGKAQRVPFDHKAHEKTATRCSTCHHQSLASCNECHTLTGAARGSGVTLERAYHNVASERSCVGCHRKATRQERCAGCHHVIKAEASRRSCSVCHRGPKAGARLLEPLGKPLGKPLVEPVLETRARAVLPAYSKDFPERVTLKILARDYAPSVMPHGRIVRKLHELTGKSRLAVQFHGGVEALCAGCHHHSKPGARPTPCSACHTRRGHSTRDKPGLGAAYHRQCIGCHQKMGLRKWLGCETCHKKAAGSRPRGGKR
jgi:hypothetical protein